MSKSEVTILLDELSSGHCETPERLLPLVYDDLRRLASGFLNNESNALTLQPTALVHEAYIRMVDWKNVSWQNRAHFFSVAAGVMRRILVDNARVKNAQKRSGMTRIMLDDAISFARKKEINILRLEEALATLEKVDARQAKLVELRFFGGLSIEETAYVMKISETTVRREWTFAKAWFQRELRR